MDYRTVSFYHEFQCIGGICEDSCCENWEIDLDDASLKLYMKQKGEFGKRLRENTRVKDKQFILKKTRCPFLNDENLCDIYIEMGENCLCETCTNFPRHIEEFDDLKEVSLTMSCPEASRIMLAKKEKLNFVCKEGCDEDYGLKPVAAKTSFPFLKKNQVNKLDKKLFDVLYETRLILFDILQCRETDVLTRGAVALIFGDEIGRKIPEKDYNAIALANENMKRKLKQKSLFSKSGLDDMFAPYIGKREQKINFLKQVLNMYMGLETIKEEWSEILLRGINLLSTGNDISESMKEFNCYYKEREYEFEHILVYYIFNYFLGASYDGDGLTKIKFAVVSYLVILLLDTACWLFKDKTFTYEEQVQIAHAYSKEVEHSYNNFESLMLVMSAHPVLSVENILIGLLS